MISSFAVAIPCYNERQNICRLLEAVLREFEGRSSLRRILVICSGSTDGTDEAVEGFRRSCDAPIVLTSEKKRSGKPAAVNALIRELRDVEVVFMISGDVLPAPGCLEQLLKHFQDPRVGVVGGRPLPEGPQDNIAVQISELLWELHHLIALHSPKSTEITAFRNLGQSIPEATLVDEAEIEWTLVSRGYRVVYEPNAVIRSQAPRTVREYVMRRRAVTLGHILLNRRTRYRMSTLSIRSRLSALRTLYRAGRLSLHVTLAGAVLEAAIYLLAWYDLTRQARIDGCWETSSSAKTEFSPPA